MSTAALPIASASKKHHARPSAKEWLGLVKSAVSAWVDDYAPSMGAALSYYSVFSLAPLLLIVISIAGLVFGQEAARGELFTQLRGLMGGEAAEAVEAMLASLAKPERSVVSTIIGVLVLVVGATTVFGELQDALDRIWRAPARDRSAGWWKLLRSRLLSFGMILGIAFLLVVSLVMSAMVAALGKWWSGAFGGWEVLLQMVNIAVGFALTTAVFAMIYKFMPRAKVEWHDVWIGAAITAALFTIGRFLIGLYIGKTGVASGFGAFGALAIIFVWVYYSAQIFLLGAEFTWVYAAKFGSMKGQLAGQANGQTVAQNADHDAKKQQLAQAEATPGLGSAERPVPGRSNEVLNAEATVDDLPTAAGATDPHAIDGELPPRPAPSPVAMTATLAVVLAARFVLPVVVMKLIDRRRHVVPRTALRH